jgi:tetratricopeptide (TPR) repeat protein
LLGEIQAKRARGYELLDRRQYAKALETFRQAVALIPSPQHRHPISLPAYAALEEGYFCAGVLREGVASVPAGDEGVRRGGELAPPPSHGAGVLELGDSDRAADALTRVYALGGRDVFDGEDDKCLAFLATRIKL